MFNFTACLVAGIAGLISGYSIGHMHISKNIRNQIDLMDEARQALIATNNKALENYSKLYGNPSKLSDLDIQLMDLWMDPEEDFFIC